MYKKLFAVFAVLGGLLSGCATIVDGSTQSMTFQSSPAEAEVLINGVVVGKTPLSIDVERAEGTTLTIRKEGFKEQTLVMPTKLNTTFWGNVILGGLPGSTTDAVSGASREFIPGSHMVTLEPAE